jgi:membrane associated rhomboid family serine protease
LGIYDRDYYRQQQQPGVSSYAPRTVIGAIIVVNVVIWIADAFTSSDGGHSHWLSDALAVHDYTLFRPWLWWEFLTAGFAHSPNEFNHILGNMLVLFFLGRDVEDRYGSKEFLRVYLVMVVLASVVWNLLNARTVGYTMAFGASGAIAGVVVLYALNFPNRTLLLFFVIPMPAWLLGALFVAYDMYGQIILKDSNIAYSMHLTGAAFAFVYYQRGWNLTRLTSGRIPWPSFRRKPRLRIHTPEEESTPDLSVEVDRILEKIYREGEAGLTAKERKTLETASREYQKRKSRNDE